MVVEKHLKNELTREIVNDRISRGDLLITSCRIDTRSSTHAILSVYNRGGHCGRLIMSIEDAMATARRLIPDGDDNA